MDAPGEGSRPEASSRKKSSIDDCPTCGAPVSPFVTKCPYCGVDVARRSRWRARKLRLRRRLREARIKRPEQIERVRRIPRDVAPLSPQTPFAVGFLVLANIFAYLAFDVRGDLISDPGALSIDALGSGEWPRLITYQFLHTGLLELVFSVLLLVVFAIMIEQRYGHLTALATYLVAGVGGGLLAYAVGVDAVIAGSLVSTLGLMGGWLVSIARPEPLERSYPLPAGLLLVAVIFLFGLVQEGIDAWALLGGLVAGALTVGLVEVVRTKRVGGASGL